MTEEIDAHVARKYEISQRLGKGAYGIVWKAVDKRTRQTVALKKCFDAFRNATDAQRTYREIEYLKQLGEHGGHSNIIRLLSVIKAENNKDIYLVFEYMETDLHAVIRAGILEHVHKQYITYQLLRAIKYMHTGDLLHRDLKPSNVLLNADCHLKVCDFGLCRSITEDPANKAAYSEYTATRWYRSPEILMGSTKYSTGVDIWALGCILGEMLLGKPLFPGTSTMNQLERILELTGVPASEDLQSIQSPFAANMLESLAKPSIKPLEEMIPNAPADGLDFIRRCMHFNPDKRASVEALLDHSYVAQFRKIDEELSAPRKFKIGSNDNIKYTVDDYRNRIYDLIRQAKHDKTTTKRSTVAKPALQANASSIPQDPSTNSMSAAQAQPTVVRHQA